MKYSFFLAVFCCISSCGNIWEKSEKCKENIKLDCICTKEYEPVCGCNGKTYGNKCEAECHGIKKYKKGEC